MHDHNLDDLIIDKVEPKNSKLKGFLTIIALLIVILIVAIILTRILLKTPENNDLVFEQESTELIAPELELKETPNPDEIEKTKPEIMKEPAVVIQKEEPKPVVQLPVEPKAVETKKEPVLSNIAEQEVKAPAAVKTTSSAAKDAADIAYWEAVQAKRKAEKEAREKAAQVAKPVEAKKIELPVIEQPKPVVKPVEKVVVKKPTPKPAAVKPAPKQLSTGTYFVQVGAFRNQPSSRFLSVIRNNGYRYFMTKPSKTGIKRLLIGPFKDRAEVDRALVRIQDRIHKHAFVVKR